MKFGLLGAADIAKRRFLPALKKCSEHEFVMLGVSGNERLEAGKSLAEEFSGYAVVGYDVVLENDSIDAVYIPLPPSHHYEWAKKALLSGKHVIVEKPSTINLDDTVDLVNIARERELVITENYGFTHHPQTKLIKSLIAEDKIGEIRNIRTAFGFPKRQAEDIRHKKALGGGGLLDAGGYTIKTGFEYLGETAEVVTTSLNYLDEFDVDMFGSLTMKNSDGLTMQASFGMDSFYRCELEIWGQKGVIKASRYYTAPEDFVPQVVLTTNDGDVIYNADKADQFRLMIDYFTSCINDKNVRESAYGELIRQIEQIQCAFNFAEQ